MHGSVDRSPPRAFVLAVLVGWWTATFLCESVDAHAIRATADRVLRSGPAPRSASRGTNAPLPSPRALRQARGIGRRRSVDLVRFLWEVGPEAPIETLRGFGPRTSAAAREVLSGLERSP